MKLGLVTYSNSTDNYGQVLQALSTKIYLNKFGHEVFLLRLKENVSLIKSMHNKILTIMRNLFPFMRSEKGRIFSQWATQSHRSEKKHPRLFESFRTQYFSILSGSYEDILSYKLDGYVSGSDQIWGSPSEWYMLKWTPDERCRIAIAPSVGHGSYADNNQIQLVKEYLKRYKFITVRENTGLELCEKCSIKASKVLDPTFLTQSCDYLKYCKVAKTVKPYVFVYLVGAEISISVQDIFQFAKKNKLDVKYIESQGRNENVHDKIFATVPEWIGLISASSYVITNSFHGMAFSLIFKKKFMVFPITGVLSGMNTRIIDLAEEMKVVNHIYNGDFECLFNDVNWDFVQNKIDENYQEMKKYLSNI